MNLISNHFSFHVAHLIHFFCYHVVSYRFLLFSVNGVLAISRAFGDTQFKASGCLSDKKQSGEASAATAAAAAAAVGIDSGLTSPPRTTP